LAEENSKENAGKGGGKGKMGSTPGGVETDRQNLEVGKEKYKTS